MIITLPDTTTNDVNRRLVEVREEGGAVALGRVLTLVIASARVDLEDAVAAANAASREHPCRVIVVAPGDGPGTGRLDAEIRVGGDAGASEVVVLRADDALREHADTLVIPLLLPDAPIVVWWPHEVPKDPATDPLGALAIRRITDTMECSDPVASLDRLAQVYRPGDTDLAWTRTTIWRAVLAACLDLPPYDRVVRAVVTGDPVHPSVDLLSAWLAQFLRCPVERLDAEATHGITRVALHRRSGDIVIDRPDGRNATLVQPGQPVQAMIWPLRTLEDCLIEELRRMDPDDVYGEVLRKGMPRLGAR